MAAGREGDTSLWLHNKLGTSNDTWVGGSICSQYNLDVLGNIRECFLYLQPQVKLKLLLSFFHIPRRNADEWHSELEEILELGRADSDPWVSMVAEIMLPFPATGCLSEEFNASEVSGQIFHTLVGDIRKIIKEKSDGSAALVPLESQYLNHSALTDLYGSPPPPMQHFKLKRKPKAAALRAELLNKSVEAANQLKKHPMPTVPLRSRGIPRKMTDTTPLKGIPSRSLGSFGRSSFANFNRSGVRSLAGPKEGGIKLLDINEQPFGVGLSAAARKKMKLDAELAEKAAAASAQPPKMPLTPMIASGKLLDNHIAEDIKPARPDYSLEATTDLTVPTPPRARTFSGMADVTTSPQDGAEEYIDQQEQIQQHVSDNLAILTERKPPIIALTREIQIEAPNPPQQPVPARIFYTRPVGENAKVAPPMGSPPVGTIPGLRPGAGITYATLQPVQPSGSPARTPGTQANPLLIMQQPPQRQILSGASVQQPSRHFTLVATPLVQQVQPSRTVQLPAISPGGGVTTVMAQQVPPSQGSANHLPKKGLSLTREQMAEAQEMFRTANRVTRPEKALILGFMAGSRENPCPHLGNIVTIKLSEEQEALQQPNGTLVSVSIETLFQMNYNTGEWRRLRKQRSLQSVQ